MSTGAGRRPGFTIFPWLVFAPVAMANPDLGGMKMYVYPEQSDSTELNLTRMQQDGTNTRMKMVVFDSGGSARPVTATERQPGAAGHDSTEPVVLDEYPRRQKPQAEMAVKSYGELGYRNDELKWNIGWPTGSPNVVSELQWYNVQSAVIAGGTDITFDNWQVEGKMAYGQVIDGESRDSDYASDNRQDEFSRSYAHTNDGMSIDLSSSLGYHLTIAHKNRAPLWRFTPKLGFSFHTQQFNDTDGTLVIADTAKGQKLIPGYTAPPLGDFSGLDSTYEGTWFGPWGGLSSQLVFTDRFSFQAGVEYHWISYEGTGHWNLRSDLQQPKSFTHDSDGEGWVVSAVARYLVTPDWVVRLSAQYQDWQANNDGKGTFYFSDGSKIVSPFNEAKWKSYGLNLGVEYVF